MNSPRVVTLFMGIRLCRKYRKLSRYLHGAAFPDLRDEKIRMRDANDTPARPPTKTQNPPAILGHLPSEMPERRNERGVYSARIMTLLLLTSTTPPLISKKISRSEEHT